MDILANLMLLLLMALPWIVVVAVNGHLFRRELLLNPAPRISGVRRSLLALLTTFVSMLLLSVLWYSYHRLGAELAYHDPVTVFWLFYALALIAALLLWLLDYGVQLLLVPQIPQRFAARMAFRLLAGFVYILAAIGACYVLLVPR